MTTTTPADTLRDQLVDALGATFTPDPTDPDMPAWVANWRGTLYAFAFAANTKTVVAIYVTDEQATRVVGYTVDVGLITNEISLSGQDVAATTAAVAAALLRQ